MTEGKKDTICIKPAETDEELCGKGYVHCTSWQEAYRGIVSDRYLDSMTVAATTARATVPGKHPGRQGSGERRRVRRIWRVER